MSFAVREKLEDYFLYYLTEIRSTQCWSSPDVDPSYADAFLKAMQLAGYGATEENVRNFEKCIMKYRIALGILEVLHGYATVLSDAENIAKCTFDRHLQPVYVVISLLSGLAFLYVDVLNHW